MQSNKPLISQALSKGIGHKYSEEFWLRCRKSIQEENDRANEAERRLRPSPELLQMPFDM